VTGALDRFGAICSAFGAGAQRGQGSGLLAILVAAAVTVIYLRAACGGGPSRRAWPRRRAASFVAGMAALALALSAPLVHAAHADLRWHMAQHLLLGMFAPLGIVFGAPGTLLLRTVPVRVARALTAFAGSAPVRLLIHPVTALLLDMGGMYALYLTPLFAASLSDPLLHVLVHVHFLVSGCLYTWAVAGPDMVPRRPGVRLRLFVLFLGTAAHAALAKFLYAGVLPAGTPYGVDQILTGAQIMYYGGDLAELALVIALLSDAFSGRAGRSGAFGRRRAEATA
jgi:putative membrane protein